MLSSIRWTLQLWHAAVLLLVICSFGLALYFGISNSKFKQVDAELMGEANAAVARIHGPPGPPPERHGRPPRDGPGPDHDHFGPGPPPDDPPGPHHRPPPLSLEQAVAHDLERPAGLAPFNTATDAGPYLAAWLSNGQLVLASGPRDLPFPGSALARSGGRLIRQRGEFREAVVSGPFGIQVLVGRSVRKESVELHQLVWLLLGLGGSVLVVGLAGGWLLAGRAISPIRDITRTAASISVSNLSRRINLSSPHNELGDLAAVLNAMFDRLDSAFQQQVRFTADASHELRTPLSVIHSQSELALTRDRAPDEYRGALEVCLRSARRMKSLVDSLLVLARADAGKLELSREPFDLRETVADCIEMVRPLACQRNIRIESDLSPAPVVGDPFRVAQVVTNLLTNAIHYNHEGGTIDVKVSADTSGVCLIVSDTGPGIPIEDQPHVFERFYRVDKARSRQFGGSGLGLAICRSIVSAQGGCIDFISRPGEGSTFTVRLPHPPSTT